MSETEFGKDPEDVEGVCEYCGTTEGVTLTVNPYQADVNGDHTPCWLCGACHGGLADEI